MIYLPRVILFGLFIVLIQACSSTEKVNPNTAEGAFEMAQQMEKADRYEEALSRYRQVKAKHPYSKFATMAELAMADLHFKRESWIEAQSAYELFIQFHPSHPKRDYVTFRLAESFYNQLPSVISRDLSMANKALLYYSETSNKFPDSKYAAEAKKKYKDVQKMLAEKQLFIADFYFDRDQWLSALGRYENVIERFQNLGFDAKALKKAALSAQKLGQKDKALAYVAQLKKKHPGSSEAKSIDEEVD